MHSTSLYGLKLSVLRGMGAKALATDHRAENAINNGFPSASCDHLSVYSSC